ncbi:MAG: transcription/translation regulatory transformer protein RfaH [Gammaproteobacteria bacterium]|nr:transcription/translation regulatory transformer protein RfaH [Gammaproteobacteria bacterium]MBU1723859.1 transcription/translation regulatory transformer protein RfaH [Gammaproteobacteria bacterium]MBU2004501.1 transcription/translation regulatory transformer protein RfaH [Gammaproteobacteria bacterium]
MMQEIQRNWYLLTSKPHKDELAETNLDRQGYEVYRPLAKRLHRCRGKMVTRTESLFPRYMFISLDNGVEDNWSPIRSTLGVASFVRFGTLNLPTAVPNSLIEALKAQEDVLGERAIDLDRFHKGEEVIITEGPFRGLKAMFQHYDGENRAIILLQILQAQRPSKLSISPAHLLVA